MKKSQGFFIVFFITLYILSPMNCNGDAINYISKNLDLACISPVQSMKDLKGERLNGKGITISIIDSGIKECMDDRICDQFNFCHNTRDVLDSSGHGTKVLHIITKIAPAASILVYKVFQDESGSARIKDVADAIKRSVKYKANVINISGGIYGDEILLREAIQYATEHGVIIVSGAGNEGSPCGITSPGDDPEVITVGATTLEGDDVAWYSNLGPNLDTGEIKPDLVAPGDYKKNCRGTSFSAPIVTGAVALLLQRYPTWNCTDVKSALGSTANPLKRNGEILLPIQQGSGRINLLKAINTSTLFSAAHIYFYQHTTKLEVRNIGSAPRQYLLKWNWNGPHKGLVEQLIPSSFVLQPGQSAPLILSLKTDPLNIEQCCYYPNLKVISEDEEWNIPIAVDSPYAFEGS